jgi:hypothetical protein
MGGDPVYMTLGPRTKATVFKTEHPTHLISPWLPTGSPCVRRSKLNGVINDKALRLIDRFGIVRANQRFEPYERPSPSTV